MKKETNVEESGEASMRDDVRRDGRRVASPARRRSRYGRRGDTVSNTVEEQGGESPETRVDLHVMSLTCRAIHPRRGGVRTESERKPRRARRALRLVCFIGE